MKQIISLDHAECGSDVHTRYLDSSLIQPNHSSKKSKLFNRSSIPSIELVFVTLGHDIDDNLLQQPIDQ